MTGNKAYLAEFQDFNGGPVAFGGSKGYITGKGKIKTGKLDFEDVCFVKELQHFNLFSVSQMCDKKNKVLFTDSECLVLSPEFKLPDENQVLLKIPRQNNMYSFNLENIVPSGGLACLIAKATTDESNKWHRRLGHVNFKNLNKLVKGNLVRGLPSKIFQNDHTCVACQKGKQHKASCKAKSVSSISHSLQLLHMDLFGPTSVRSLNHKTYCLVITDDFSRFSWVFFLRTKDETSAILKDFIRQIENQLNQKVKTIRCDNGTEFKNKDVIEFCGSKGIKREYSNARTPQQNGVAERKNRTLIEAARTMLADSFLPNTFWAEAVSTACYVLNRVLVTKPHNKTPYELLTRKGPTWLFDLDYLTDSMNYHPVRSENQANLNAGQQEANQNAGTNDIIDAGDSEKEDESAQDCFVLPIWPSYSSTITPNLKTDEKREGPREEEQVFMDELERLKRAAKTSSTNILSTVSTLAKASSTNLVNTVSIPVSTTSPNEGLYLSDPTNPEQDDSEIPPLEDIYQNSSDGIFTTSSYDDEGAVADFTNLETVVNVCPIPTSRIISSHPSALILVNHMETENAQDVGRTREIKDEENELDEDILSTEDVLSIDKEKDSTDMEKVSTDRPIVSTDGSKVSTDRQVKGTNEQIEGTEEQIESTNGQRKGTEDHIEEGSATQATQTPTSTIFGDDETIAKVLLNMSQAKAVSREKEKGVELKDIEETDRPRPTSTRSLLTLKPLLKIDPKEKGKKKIEEEDEYESESDGIPEAEKKFKQLESDEEMARKMHRKNRLLAEKLQEQEREQFTIEERAKFLHDTIAAQRKFLAQQRSEAIRNRPPTKNRLRNQMMTYLKQVGNFKHTELKIKKFEEVQALYEKIKRSDEDFISIGSAEDERLIKRMNEKGIDSSKSEVIKEENKEEAKEENKEEESTKMRKLGTRKKIKSRKRRFIQNTSEDDSEKENDELRLHLTIAPDEEKEVDYEILDRKYPIKEWKTECLGIKPQDDKAEHLEEINQNVVIRSNGQKRYFGTLMRVLSIFDREDLNAVYQLVMDRYQDEIPEGFDRVLWGDLMVMFNPDDEDKFWNSQLDWIIVSWKLHSSSGVHTLVTETGLVIHMLVEKKYPLRKEVLMQMLKLKLESEEDSTMALELIKFVKKLLAELEPED
ncbi:putative ribonuclease H-like domain-containing protein [Tanacetum coccineum]|uniref:Ribonuclease H-like domain-containing protein n=1 Tax=Tanacetum coccineum TaxID=301880 RepID=A0ABQ5FWH5_9ASTR